MVLRPRRGAKLEILSKPVLVFATGFAIVQCIGSLNLPAEAASAKHDGAVECLVIGNHVSRNLDIASRSRNNLKAKQRFSNWMIDHNVLKRGMRVLLFWRANVDGRPVLRIAVNKEQSKKTNLLSITDDTIVAGFFNSDRMTTRSWTFALNFAQERVMASGITSNFSGMRSQSPILSCIFHAPGDPAFESTLKEDDWQRCCANE